MTTAKESPDSGQANGTNGFGQGKLYNVRLFARELYDVSSDLFIEVADGVTEDEVKAMGGDEIYAQLGPFEVCPEWDQDWLEDREVKPDLTMTAAGEIAFAPDARIQRNEDGTLVVVVE